MAKNRAKAEYEKDLFGSPVVEIDTSEKTLREILDKLSNAYDENSFRVKLSAGEIGISAVVIKDAITDNKATVTDEGKLKVDVDFPDSFPLPESQVEELRNVNITNDYIYVDVINENFPLPENQITEIKNKLRVMAKQGETYILIEGYEGQKNLTWDENGNLTEIRMVVIKDNGETVTLRKTLYWDTNGNLTQVSEWEVV